MKTKASFRNIGIQYVMKNSVKICLLSITIALFSASISLYFIFTSTALQSDLQRMARPSLYRIVWEDIRNSRTLLGAYEQPPERVTSVWVNITDENFSKTKAQIIIEAEHKKYTYDLVAEGRWKLPLLFGWRNINVERLVSIESTL